MRKRQAEGTPAKRGNDGEHEHSKQREEDGRSLTVIVMCFRKASQSDRVRPGMGGGGGAVV